tara:strand:+ start:48517 stop:49362 length:846 start_codon:yes stop_codon:yes gene_type:complete
MKTYLKLTILAFIITVLSCTDVIDVEVQTAPARLTIEASLDWEKGTAGNEQIIKLSTSTAYFDSNTDTSVVGASVKVTNNNSGAIFVFDDQNNGEYSTSSFVPVINQTYTLEVIYKDETYTATETLMSVVDITELTQSRKKGFNDESLEVNVIFTDPEEEENFYLFKFKEQGDLLPYLEDGDDEFVNGNEISWYFEKEEDDSTDKIEAFVPGDIVDIELYGISEEYSNYIGILIEQSEGAGLFSSTPVALKGNCINLTDPENFAYGYFRLTEVVKKSYTFE